MQNQQTPQVLAQPFCAQGDKNTIPNAATGSNLASLQEGFPAITELPASQGGIPPERQDFNGAMNLNSQFYFAFQNGWWPTFTQEVSDAIGGYPQNAILCYFVPESNSVQFVRSLIPNNTYNFVTTPSYIGQYWVKCLMESAGLPIGAVYYSQSALTADNPGAVPAWQGVFEQNGSQTYPEFFSWITSHTELCITKTEYDSNITTYGECPFYVLNETSAGNLRFPQLINYIKNANSTDGITQSSAGLPNITGSVSGIRVGDFAAEGALSSSKTTGKTSQTMANVINQNDAEVIVDASDSSAVYGKSDEVTPAHTTLYPWIVVNPSATSISQCVLLSQVGTANGVASLDDNACVPFAQMPAEVVDNIDLPFDPSAYGWPDIRPAARPNAIVLLAGVASDYSSYDNLGFIATCEGGYNVFIDGVQYGTTYASGAQCSITWSQYSATAGFSVTQPAALTAHIVQLVPATYGNTISAYQGARVASSGNEQQGILWAHFNLNNVIALVNAFSCYNTFINTSLLAITSASDTLKVSSISGMLGQAADLYTKFSSCAFLPVLDLGGQAMSGGGAFNTDGLNKIRLKNGTINQLNAFSSNNTALQRIELDNVSLITTSSSFGSYTVDNFLFNANSLQELPPVDMTYCQSAYPLVSNAVSLKDTYLDLGYATQLKRFGIYGTSQYPINGLKQLLVSQQAPFDYTTAPQINVAYTGLDQNALVALFNSLPYNVGYSVVGNPTIQNGVASGFSSNDYLNIASGLSFNSLEAVINAKEIPSSAENQGCILRLTGDINLNVFLQTDGSVRIYYKNSSGNSAYLPAFSYVSNGFFKITISASGVNTYFSSDGASFSPVATSTDEPAGLSFTNAIFGYLSSTLQAFPGAIDLNNSYINVNNIPWFRGTAAMDKTINITGAAGASSLTAEQLAIATDKGWTVTR